MSNPASINAKPISNPPSGRGGGPDIKNGPVVGVGYNIAREARRLEQVEAGESAAKPSKVLGNEPSVAQYRKDADV